MQTTGDFVSAAAEFAAGVKHCHDNFQSRFVGIFRVGINRDSPTVIRDSNGIVCVHNNINFIGKTCNSLVHGVVQNLGHQMVQSCFIGAADIHSRPVADRLKPFQNFNGLGAVIGYFRSCSIKQIRHFILSIPQKALYF